jgi:cytochrome c oxidase subunit 3
MMEKHQEYFVPHQSHWPIVAAVGLFMTMGGLAMTLNDLKSGSSAGFSQFLFIGGSLVMAYMLFGWFGNVIKESGDGLYSPQMDRSFRWGMSWFIFSEVMFFVGFFGVLFYARFLSIPWLAGEGDKGVSNMLWPDFVAQWPLLNMPNPTDYPSPKGVIDPWHVPLINTLILVTSSFTLSFAHHALKQGQRLKLKAFLVITLVLGVTFLALQVMEYIEAYGHLDLTLESGIYASTFFLLTGFHGAHVTIGTLIIFVLFIRVLKGHFTEDKHFAFEAGAWYWHFVDVVWLLLFMLVYVF